MKFEAIKHTDVRGKILYYVKLESNGNEMLINIGEKSYHHIIKITNEEKIKTEEKPVRKTAQ